MHDDRTRPSQAHEVLVDRVAGESGPPLLHLSLVTHARPDVGVEDVGPGSGLGGLPYEPDLGACLRRPLLGRGSDGALGLVAHRTRQAAMSQEFATLLPSPM